MVCSVVVQNFGLGPGRRQVVPNCKRDLSRTARVVGGIDLVGTEFDSGSVDVNLHGIHSVHA